MEAQRESLCQAGSLREDDVEQSSHQPVMDEQYKQETTFVVLGHQESGASVATVHLSILTDSVPHGLAPLQSCSLLHPLPVLLQFTPHRTFHVSVCFPTPIVCLLEPQFCAQETPLHS